MPSDAASCWACADIGPFIDSLRGIVCLMRAWKEFEGKVQSLMKCDVVGRVVSRGSGARRVTFFFLCLGLCAQPAASSGGHCARCTQSLTQFSQRPPLAMPRLSEYELERQANIQRNQELLKSLGIFNAEVAPSRKAVRQHLSYLRSVRSVVTYL